MSWVCKNLVSFTSQKSLRDKIFLRPPADLQSASMPDEPHSDSCKSAGGGDVTSPELKLFMLDSSAHLYLQHYEMSADNEVGWVEWSEKSSSEASRLDSQALTTFRLQGRLKRMREKLAFCCWMWKCFAFRFFWKSALQIYYKNI